MIVEELIARGADINASTPSGDTALHFASQYRVATFLCVLVASGANKDARNSVRIPFLCDNFYHIYRILRSVRMKSMNSLFVTSNV